MKILNVLWHFYDNPIIILLTARELETQRKAKSIKKREIFHGKLGLFKQHISIKFVSNSSILPALNANLRIKIAEKYFFTPKLTRRLRKIGFTENWL